MVDDYPNYLGFQAPSIDRSILIDAQGRMRKANLFLEMYDGAPKYEPIYTMRDYERNGLPSAYLIYMTSIDEFDAAAKLVGSLRHWRYLLRSNWFMNGNTVKGFDGLIQWREDMLARDASTGKGALIKQVKKGDTSAARKIIDMAKSVAPKVGRPGTKAAEAEKVAEQKKVDRAKRIEKAATARAERNEA